MANLFQRSKKLEVVSVSDDNNCATIILHDEDHTLGNSLRYMLNKNPAVKFCGYSMPHPNERKVVLQIQTYASKELVRSESDEADKDNYQTAMECFEKGLRDLIDVSEHIKSMFEEEYEKFESSNPMQLDS